ncbi:MAG: DUF2877 domain-containing protein [Bacillota bacterium]
MCKKPRASESTANVLQLGSTAYRILSREKSGILHSMFANAVNLMFSDDYLITIMPEGLSFSNQAVIVSNRDFARLANEFGSSGDRIVPDAMLSYSSCDVVDLSIPDSMTYTEEYCISENIAACISELKAQDNEGFAPFLLGYDNLYTELLRVKLKAVDFDVSVNNGERLAGFLSGIIGLGQGLTPSGDDFVYGFLSSMFYYCNFKQLCVEGVQKAAELLSLEAKHKTTIISYNMLRSCIKGEFNQAVRDFNIALLKSKHTADAFHRVLDIGSSSGADMAAGILYGYQKLLEKEV